MIEDFIAFHFWGENVKAHSQFICHVKSLALNKKYSYSLISQERSYLMGFSIAWIMFFHSSFNLSGFTLLKAYHDFGNIGVDVFLFLSGVGLYFSANKLIQSNKRMMPSFYAKRIIRIMPATIICLLPWYLYLYNGRNINPIKFVLDITSLSFWIDGNNRGWYIALTVVLYCIYPLIFKAISFHNYKKNIIICTCLSAVVILFNFAVCFLFPNWFNLINIALGRIPIFLIGCFIAPMVYNKEKFSVKELAIAYIGLPIVTIIFCRFDYSLQLFGINRYLYAIMTVCIVLILARISSLNHELLTFRMFSFLGRYTLELYLTHTQIQTVMNDFLSQKVSSFWINVVAIFLSLVISIILHEILDYFINIKHKDLLSFW